MNYDTLQRSLSYNLTIVFLLFCIFAKGQETPATFKNPILPGYSPDPSICRVGDDYYLVNSSFTLFPGLPIYHSKDLVNWKQIGHALSNPTHINFDGVLDRDGIWAPTIRYHDGLFYLITTAYKSGGNFYITAKNPAGPWSDPIWLKDAPGIDPSLFWDDDGKCYYVGNVYNKETKGQVISWNQEIDLKTGKFLGERKLLTGGHANNAAYGEGPHIYKIDKDYLLLMAEGGTDQYHAVTSHHSKTIQGEYSADKINPVITHRHLGKDYPIQAVGHSDLVQTQNGDWWAVLLAKRLVDGEVPLARETFLCKVVFENGTPIYNPGYGRVLMEQERPNLPWTPVKPEPIRDEFNSDSLSMIWHTIGTPKGKFYSLDKGKLTLSLRPLVVDSLKNSSMLIQRTRNFQFTATTKLEFKTSKDNEQAGMILHRNNDSYFMVLKEKARIVLIRKSAGKKEVLAEIPYNNPEVFISAKADNLKLQLSIGETLESMINIGEVQSMAVISENKNNRFNGAGIGMYASSNGQASKNSALFDWFEYKAQD